MWLINNSVNFDINVESEEFMTIIVFSETNKYFEYCGDEHSHILSIMILKYFFFSFRAMIKVSIKGLKNLYVWQGIGAYL